MTGRRIKVGVVGASITGGPAGTGRWGRIHGSVFHTLPETELVAVCTARRETAEAAARAYGARYAFTDYRELAQLEELDLVSVALRVDMHAPVVTAALEAGKHVVCEWPLAVTTQEAQDMYSMAEARRLHHAVVLQSSCSPPVMYLRDLIAGGYIGQPLVANVVHFHERGMLEKWSNALYLERKEGGGNALSVIGGHTLDAMSWCLGELDSLCADVETLIKDGTLEDTGERIQITSIDNVCVIGRLKSGAMVTVQVSWTTSPHLGWQMYVYGTEGCLMATSDGHYHFVGMTLRGGKRGQHTLRRLRIPTRYNWTPEFSTDVSAFPVAQLVRRAVGGIREGSEVARPNFLDALRLHRLLDAIQQSSRRRSWVNVGETPT